MAGIEEQKDKLNGELKDFMDNAINEYTQFLENNHPCCFIRNSFNINYDSDWKHPEAQARNILYSSYVQIADYMKVFSDIIKSLMIRNRIKVVSFCPGPLTDLHALQRVIPNKFIDFTAVDSTTWKHALAEKPFKGALSREEGQIHKWFMENPSMDADLYIIHRDRLKVTLDSLWSGMRKVKCRKSRFTLLVLDSIQSESIELSKEYRDRMDKQIKAIAKHLKDRNGNPYLVQDRSIDTEPDKPHINTYMCNSAVGIPFRPDYDYLKLFSDDIDIKCPIDPSQLTLDCQEALKYKPCMHLGITYAHAYDFMTEKELQQKKECEEIAF